MTLDEAIAHAREVAEKNRRAMSFESEDNKVLTMVLILVITRLLMIFLKMLKI